MVARVNPEPRSLAENEHYYEVLTPEYGVLVPILDDGTGPTEWGADWALVVATSAREAVRIAVKAWLRGENACVYDPGPYGVSYGYRGYCVRQREDGECPWTGVRAQVMRCGHGFEYRGPIGALQDAHAEGHDICPDCDRELQEHMADV